MTNLPVAIVSALLLHAPAAGAFVLHCQHPAVLISFSGPTDGKSTLSVKEDVTDAADAVTIEIIESDLDASTFLAEMEEEIEGVAALKEAAGIGTLIPKVGDMYARAIAKMEAMAWKSISRHQVDMEEFNNEIDVAIKNELDAEARKNGPLVAFSFLGLAIAIAMVVIAPDL